MRTAIVLILLIITACNKNDEAAPLEASFKIHNGTGHILENVQMYSIKIKNLPPGTSSKWHITPDRDVIGDRNEFSFRANGVRFLALVVPDTTVVGDEIFINSLVFSAYPEPRWSRDSN